MFLEVFWVVCRNQKLREGERKEEEHKERGISMTSLSFSLGWVRNKSKVFFGVFLKNLVFKRLFT